MTTDAHHPRGVLWICILLAVLIATALIGVRTQGQHNEEDTRAQESSVVAQEFLRHLAGDDLSDACILVIDPGGFLNGCQEQLADMKFRPPSKVKVLRAHILDDGTARVLGTDIQPKDSHHVAITLRPVGSDWRVTSLRGVDLVN